MPKKYVSNKTTNIYRTKAKQKTDKLPQVTVQVTVSYYFFSHFSKVFDLIYNFYLVKNEYDILEPKV